MLWFFPYYEYMTHVQIVSEFLQDIGRIGSYENEVATPHVFIIHFHLLQWPQKLNRENKSMEVSSVFVFLFLHLIINHHQHSSHW